MAIRRIVISALILSLVSMFGLPVSISQAAALTSMDDTLSTVEASVNANHTIEFVATTAITASQTITVTFPAGFVLTGLVESGVASDYDLAEDTDASPATCTGTMTEETLDGTATTTTWGAAFSGQVVTLTAPSNAATYIAAGACVQIQIGTNATNEFTGVNQIDNPTAATYKIDLATTSDSGSLAVSIIADDTVNVTSTVDPTITFTITDTTVGFGTLTTANARWATGDLAGVGSQPAAASGAHEMTIATNALTGYAITYNGATLTSGANTIDVASITNDGDGAPGTEQFGISLDDGAGNVTIAAGYDYAAVADYTFVASTTTTIASETISTATETIDVQYLANIASTTQPGTYTTNVRYIATGTF